MVNKRGFTLVELIVVVIIISFLAAMGFTSFRNAKTIARAKQLLADMEALMAAEKQYRLENGSWLFCIEGGNHPTVPKCNAALNLNIKGSADREVWANFNPTLGHLYVGGYENLPPACSYQLGDNEDVPMEITRRQGCPVLR